MTDMTTILPLTSARLAVSRREKFLLIGPILALYEFTFLPMALRWVQVFWHIAVSPCAYTVRTIGFEKFTFLAVLC